MKTADVRISAGTALRIGAAILACLLIADSLARVARLRIVPFDMAQLAAGTALAVLLIPKEYGRTALGTTLAVAAVLGIARVLYAVLQAALRGDTVQWSSERIVVQLVASGIYAGLGVWLRRVGRRCSKTPE